MRELRIHAAPVLQIKRNPTCASVISVDAKGVIEYWPNDGSDGLPAGLGFRYKTETHLYELAKCKARPTSLSVSPDGAHFAVTSSDAKVRLFRDPEPSPNPEPNRNPEPNPNPNPEPEPNPNPEPNQVRLFRYATGKTRRTYDEVTLTLTRTLTLTLT